MPWSEYSRATNLFICLCLYNPRYFVEIQFASLELLKTKEKKPGLLGGPFC